MADLSEVCFYGNFDLIEAEEHNAEDNLDQNVSLTIEITNQEWKEIEFALSQSEGLEINGNVEHQPQQSCSQNERFRSVSNEDIQKYEDANQSKSTKRNTAWALKIFQDWHRDVYGVSLDFKSVEPQYLADLMSRFYGEAWPNPKFMKKDSPTEYHKNTLLNIRAGINRHLQDLERNINIVCDDCFKKSTRILNGILKERMRLGLSRPTKHKDIITNEDLMTISTYLEGYSTSPVVLRQAVWYNLAIHFVSRGLEFHKQLRMNSFDFKSDAKGEYVTINHETQQKNFQGDLGNKEAPSDKRMYAIKDSNNCPVKILRLFLEKSDAGAEMLFNHYIRGDFLNAGALYTTKPLSPRSFTNMMAEICKAAGTNNKYTAHCLRATCIEALSHSGYEARCIMYLSGHRNEASLRSYNRNCSDEQKRNMFSTLSAIACPSSESQIITNNNELSQENSTQLPVVASPQLAQVINNREFAVPNAYNLTLTSSSFTSGFLSHSTFHGCTFNFK